ncbi:N-alpha-acetyltransferase 40 [Tyrophagus putrescentiae]|nr:N-alpha-acetyltransferase 40 [Tyrophagus putrescentiae]
MPQAKAKRSSASAAPPPKALLQAANSRANPLASLADFDAAGQCLRRTISGSSKTFPKISNDSSDHPSPPPPLELRIVCRTWAQLDQATRQWMLDLTEANMAEFYRQSAWGWNRSSKEGELRHPSARHLLVYGGEKEEEGSQENSAKNSSSESSSKTSSSSSSQQIEASSSSPIAFVHFRFEEGYAEDATLYCYELQLVEGVRRRGIGAALMDLLQQLATVHRMKKVLLTVLTGNTEAVQFYVEGLKFAVDRHSPSRFKTEPVDYEILSKKVVVVEEVKGKKK